MDLKALQLTARFSLPPNSLGYCGMNSAPERFKSCVISGKCSGVSSELSKFIVLHPYLKTLAKITGLPKYSYAVSEAYWLGNNELLKAKPEHYFLLLENFKNQGVPDWLIQELKTQIPNKFVPTHLFQILHVGVGRASGSVPFNLTSITNCMIRWGEVVEIAKTGVKVNLTTLRKIKSGYKLCKKLETHLVVPHFIPNLKLGDVVTVHWGQITKRLSELEVAKISYWTQFVIDLF